jgi:hypothetical protein
MNRDAVEKLAKEIAPDYYNDASHVSTDIIFLQDFASRIESLVREECLNDLQFIAIGLAEGEYGDNYADGAMELFDCFKKHIAAIRKSEG